ncbi:unnamed protein product [Staurois parvus]|uniref:Uncharacterized protein n=1 Tax=Staurois parvus TaxID=386267 RepID=A0ABN9E291_9NEOB|nr:unnamed protein product [Staurois parvus]
MLSLVYIAREGFFFLSWESACDQYRANQHCPDRKHHLQSLTSALLHTDRSHKTALTADERRYLAVLYLLK